MKDHDSTPGDLTPSNRPEYLRSEPLPYSPQELREPSILGVVALVLAVAGTVLSCIRSVFVLGWIVLFIAGGLSIVGLLQVGKAKRTSLIALITAVVGTQVAIIYFIWVAASSFSG